MSYSVRRMIVLCVGAIGLACLPACSSPPKAGEVSTKQLATLRQTHRDVKAGASMKQALASYPGANEVRLGTSSVDGVTIEEWKVEAFNDSKSGRDLFVSFLYFAGEKLVDVSDTRIDYRGNPELVKRWASQSGK